MSKNLIDINDGGNNSFDVNIKTRDNFLLKKEKQLKG